MSSPLSGDGHPAKSYLGAVTQELLRSDRAELNRRWSEAGFYHNRTLHRALLDGVSRYPDTQSIFCGAGQERICTNKELHDAALSVAQALRNLGVTSGDVVAVQLPAWYETALLFRAIAHIGAVALPILPAFGLSETQFVLEQSRAKILFTPARWRGIDYTARHESLRMLSDLQWSFAVGDEARQEQSWATFIGNADVDAPFELSSASADDVALILFTSGTNADPKGVLHTHNTLLREWSRPAFQLTGRFLSVLPAGHYTGYHYLLRPSTHGVGTIYMDQWLPEFAADLIERYRIEHSGGTPIFLLALLAAADRIGADLSALKSFVMGGQSMTPQLIAKADAAGFPACRVYGLTEFPTVTELDATASFDARARSDGHADEGNEIKIIGEDGCEVAVGQDGEVIVRGPEQFIGYLDAGLDLECLLPGGWFRTADIGKVDAQGNLTITDRKKDIIIRGGENISSAEVEGILMEHPAVSEAAAVAMPDPLYGERVCVFVVLREGASLTLAAVRAHFAAAAVSRHKVPERLELITSLPRNQSGKVIKFKLREAARCFGAETA